MDYIEACCCFDSSAYRGIPDAEPCRNPIDVPAVIRELDALYNAGRRTPWPFWSSGGMPPAVVETGGAN